MSRHLLVAVFFCVATLPATGAEVFTITFDLTGSGSGGDLLIFNGEETVNGEVFQQTLSLTSDRKMFVDFDGTYLDTGTAFTFEEPVATSGIVDPRLTLLGFQSVSVTENGDTFTLTSPSSGLALMSTQVSGSPVVNFTEISGVFPKTFTLTPTPGDLAVTSVVAKYELSTATAVPEPASALGLLAVFGATLLRNRNRRSGQRQSRD